MKYDKSTLRSQLLNHHLWLKVFELLSSSLLLFPQLFGRYVLRPSSNSGTFTERRTSQVIKFISPKNSLWIVQQETKRNGSLSF